MEGRNTRHSSLLHLQHGLGPPLALDQRPAHARQMKRVVALEYVLWGGSRITGGWVDK